MNEPEEEKIIDLNDIDNLINQDLSCGYVNVSTKIPVSYAILLKKIAAMKDMTIFELIQLVCDFLVRFLSDRHSLTTEMQKLMLAFHSDYGWKESFRLTDATAQPEIAQEILILQAPGKRGFKAVMIDKPYFGDYNQCENVQIILDRIIQVVAPELYKRLRFLSTEMDCNSIFELLIVLADRESTSVFDSQLRDQFNDCIRAENNRNIEYAARTRRKKAYTPDTMPTLHFKNEDVPEDDSIL